jgi:hypothetical protein
MKVNMLAWRVWKGSIEALVLHVQTSRNDLLLFQHMANSFLIVQAGLINILPSQQSHILLVEHELHEYSNKSIISMCGEAT